MNEMETEKEKLAELMHIWYLEATKELNPESYNPNAQKAYSELTEEQKFIDRYIAKKVIDYKSNEETKEAIALYQHLKNHTEVINAPINPGEPMCLVCHKTAKEILAKQRTDDE